MSVLYKNKVNAEHLGIYFGCFAPMHLGHFQNVIKAKRETDACLLIVSGYTGDRGDEIGLDLTKRFRYLRELFADEENVYVAQLNEDDIARYPNGWGDWLLKIDGLVKEAVVELPKEVTWYVGEQEYVEELNKRKPKDNIRFTDRSVIPISGTMIRENPLKHWNYITRPFRRHFSTNILVMGTASGGKTTLVKDLARTLGSPFTLEFARTYEEESNVRDDELNANDFSYLASGMFDLNRKTINNPSNNGIFISDTDVLVTKGYSELYLSEEEHQQLLPLYNMLIAKEKWDLILVIPPVTEYVDDNFRDMTHAEDNFRWDFHNRLLELIDEEGWTDKVVILDAPFNEDSNYDSKGFYARYVQAKEAVEDYVLKTYGLNIDNSLNI